MTAIGEGNRAEFGNLREPGDIRTSGGASDGSNAAFPAGRLERLIGRATPDWQVDDLVRVVERLGIRLITLLHVGGDGALKTLDFVPRDQAHLRAILERGERADGSSLFRGLKPGASDILLVPRPATAFLNPFAPTPALAVLCGHLDRTGRPLPESPDTIVRSADLRLRRDLRVELQALGEIEYFLGHSAGPHDEPRPGDRGYHATAPFVAGEDLRRRAQVLLAEMGVSVKYAHAEVGLIDARKEQGIIWEQHEIELGLSPLVEAADAIVLTRWVLLNLARAGGLTCRFDPIMKEGHAGSGLHIHCLPRALADGPAGFEADGGVGPAGRWLIGGLIEIAAALMAFGNREPGSFVRLLQSKESPAAITWGSFDRKALIRLPLVAPGVPAGQGWPPTIEFRLPDGSALPHLLLAGVAQALAHGRTVADLEGLLARTASQQPEGAAPRPAELPRDREGVAVALAERRGALEAGGVFPGTVLADALRGLNA